MLCKSINVDIAPLPEFNTSSPMYHGKFISKGTHDANCRNRDMYDVIYCNPKFTFQIFANVVSFIESLKR